MESFLQFLGGHWWLVFPLMGVMGGIGSAWERSSRRRHRRRLEILRAKSELRAVRAASRGEPAATARPARVETARARLERTTAAHDAVTRRWLEYELDVAKTIAYPAMSDGRQPLTAAFLRAKKVADGLRPASPTTRLTAEELAEYRDAVTDYEVAFDLAERDARRVKDSSFTDSERKRLDTAKQLLTVAIDQAATPAERQLAYRRVREELDGLISLSDEAVEVLEQKVALELASAGTTDAAATPELPSSEPPSSAPPSSAPLPPAPKSGPWPVPSRTSPDAPGRVIRPKSR